LQIELLNKKTVSSRINPHQRIYLNSFFLLVIRNGTEKNLYGKTENRGEYLLR
jgi:hypothetical protein